MRTLFALVCLALIAANVGAAENSIEEAKKSFERMCYHADFSQYIIGVSVSALQVHQGESGVALEHNQAWTDACLDVQISLDLPHSLSTQLPANWLGFRVFYVKVAHPDPVSSADVDPPISKLVREQVVKKNVDFIGFYRYNPYYVSSSVETLQKANKSTPVTLLPGEKWNDYCIVVFISAPREIADNNTRLPFPDIFEEVRVIYVVHLDRVALYSAHFLLPGTFFLAIVLCLSSCCLLRRYRKQRKMLDASALYFTGHSQSQVPEVEQGILINEQGIPVNEQGVPLYMMMDPSLEGPAFIINPDGTVYPMPPWGYGMMAQPAPQ